MRYNEETCAIEMSVRLLCETALMRGALDSSRRSSREAMADGARIHRKLQAEAGGYYNPEVSLTNTSSYGGLYYTVSGRADGVIRREDALVVDEIKCVRSVEFYAPPKDVFLAQMKCYAYFLAVREGLEKIGGRITYYNTDNEKIRYFNYSFLTDELRGFYFDLLSKVHWRAEFVRNHTVNEIPHASIARFPYPELREGQEIMIRECYSAMKKGKRLFAEAPTGTGKTISSLYPAVRVLGEGGADKIFYLTSKASTRSEAYRASGKLFEAGVKLRTVVVTAKEQVCMCGAKLCGMTGRANLCNPKDCEYTRQYYDRVDQAIQELLNGGNGYPRKLICEVAKKYGICPYELSLDLSELCDIIICDYNYAFDPSVYFRRYFAPENMGKRKYIFLVDEAHNLADRARDMYSAQLKLSDFVSVLKKLLSEDISFAELITELETMASVFMSLRRYCRDNLTKNADGTESGFFMSSVPVERLNKALDIFKLKVDPWLRKNKEHPLSNEISDLMLKVRKYIVVNECFDKGFRSYIEISGGDITAKTYCLDPSPIMDALLNRAHSSVLFSATLTPREYFVDVLGGRKNSVDISLPSPFDTENLCVAVADYISTRFEDRKKNAAKFASIIAASVCSKPGNYIAYFPSYACLEEVLKVFVRRYPQVETVVQKQGMNIREREVFLGSFKDDSGHLRVGFCVLGGAFAEGVDLPGSRLIGSIIFGVGLPGLSNERNIIQEYFDMNEGNGYDYAYTYPGMNNVLQAAGRVIRRDDDMGIVVLVDDRYGAPKYRELFPEHWSNVKYAGNAQSLAEIIRRFWEND